MGRSVVIIQARVSSTRLPGKILRDLAGGSVLSHVLRRCQIIKGIDEVCCAIPDLPESEPILRECGKFSVKVTQGPEEDVLERYWQAALETNADYIVRVTSDCPLIDPDICAQVLELGLGRDVDFATNNMPPSWPHGLDCEVFSFQLLAQAREAVTDPNDREHVSPWMRRSPDINWKNLAGPGVDMLKHRWTLDYKEDYDFLSQLFESPLFESDRIPSMRDVLSYLEERPELMALNQVRHTMRSDVNLYGRGSPDTEMDTGEISS